MSPHELLTGLLSLRGEVTKGVSFGFRLGILRLEKVFICRGSRKQDLNSILRFKNLIGIDGIVICFNYNDLNVGSAMQRILQTWQ